MCKQTNDLNLGIGINLGCFNWLASLSNVTGPLNSDFSSRPTNKNRGG